MIEAEPAPEAQARALGKSRVALLFVLGIVIGVWGSLCGVGGGIFAVPLFHYAFGLPLKAAIANSLVLVAVMTSGGTIAELVRHDSALHWDVVGVLTITSWLGTQIGYRVAQRMDVRRLKLAFCFLLVVVGVEILLTTHERTAQGAPEFTWSTMRLVMTLLTGLAAGVVAPLLGIGGGLIAVPALLLGVGEIGYLGARACSTAMSAFNGWQSVWLYRKKGGIQPAIALPAAAGALAGSAIGVSIAHLPGLAFGAQLLVAGTLFLVALRFGWDLRASAVTASK